MAEKHPTAIARDRWFESDEGQKCLRGRAEGEYLKNRIERAFLAGAGTASASSSERDDIAQLNAEASALRHALMEHCGCVHPDYDGDACADREQAGDGFAREDYCDVCAALAVSAGAVATPIPMVLHCPACGHQHIDAPEPETGWTNPPHKSHLCHVCLLVWRPADVATVGVKHVGMGEKDTWAPTATDACGHCRRAEGS